MRLLLISGSVRGGSSNTATLRTLQALSPEGVEAALYGGLSELPHFNPDADREAVGADGLLHEQEHRGQLEAMLATLMAEVPEAAAAPAAPSAQISRG